MSIQSNKEIEGASWMNLGLGAFIVLVPFLTDDLSASTLWSSILSGLIVMGLAGYSAYEARARHTERSYGPALGNLGVGLWVAVSGFFLAAASGAYTVINVALGLILVAVAGYTVWLAAAARRQTRGLAH